MPEAGPQRGQQRQAASRPALLRRHGGQRVPAGLANRVQVPLLRKLMGESGVHAHKTLRRAVFFLAIGA